MRPSELIKATGWDGVIIAVFEVRDLSGIIPKIQKKYPDITLVCFSHLDNEPCKAMNLMTIYVEGRAEQFFKAFPVQGIICGTKKDLMAFGVPVIRI